jgi:hypothetical protein
MPEEGSPVKYFCTTHDVTCGHPVGWCLISSSSLKMVSVKQARATAAPGMQAATCGPSPISLRLSKRGYLMRGAFAYGVTASFLLDSFTHISQLHTQIKQVVKCFAARVVVGISIPLLSWHCSWFNASTHRRPQFQFHQVLLKQLHGNSAPASQSGKVNLSSTRVLLIAR